MRRTSLVTGLVLLLLVFTACDDDDEAAEPGETTTTSGEAATTTEAPDEAVGGIELSADLTGEAEAPDPGDPDGSGSATVTLDPETGEVCYEVTVAGIDKPSAMHIHEGPPGEAGPVVVTLKEPATGDGSSEDCTSAEPDLVQRIADTPEDFYVNVHNQAFPGGAVRGNLGL